MRNNWLSIGHDCHRWLEFKKNVDPERLRTFGFNRCPYCGDPLAFDHKSVVKIELDTLHYKEKRLLQTIEDIKNAYQCEILDQFRMNSIWLVLFKVQDDGDKVAMSIQNSFREVKSAYDKRHERIVLN